MIEILLLGLACTLYVAYSEHREKEHQALTVIDRRELTPYERERYNRHIDKLNRKIKSHERATIHNQ